MLEALKRTEPIKRLESRKTSYTIRNQKNLMVHLMINIANIKTGVIKGVENLSIQQYLEKIRAYLGDMIDKI